MAQSLGDFIAEIGIIDVHEHHIPEILLNPDVNLLQLFQQSYAGWTQARPYPLPSETRDTDPLLDARAALGNNYSSVVGINSFACGWHGLGERPLEKEYKLRTGR